MRAWLRHAFAVRPESSPPTHQQLVLVDQLCHEVVRRGMATPGLILLEMSTPLSFLGSQAMRFFEPMITALFDAPQYAVFAEFLERRDSVAILMEHLERAERQRRARTSSDSPTQGSGDSPSNHQP